MQQAYCADSRCGRFAHAFNPQPLASGDVALKCCWVGDTRATVTSYRRDGGVGTVALSTDHKARKQLACAARVGVLSPHGIIMTPIVARSGGHAEGKGENRGVLRGDKIQFQP